MGLKPWIEGLDVESSFFWGGGLSGELKMALDSEF